MYKAVILDFDETVAETITGRIVALREAARVVLDLEMTAAKAREVLHTASNLEAQMAQLASGRPWAVQRLLDTYREFYYRPDRPPRRPTRE